MTVYEYDPDLYKFPRDSFHSRRVHRSKAAATLARNDQAGPRVWEAVMVTETYPGFWGHVPGARAYDATAAQVLALVDAWPQVEHVRLSALVGRERES